jgi:hypothetical protein
VSAVGRERGLARLPRDLSVRGGHVTDLSVRSMGSGDFDFRGVADTATIVSTGSGDVSVKGVKGKPSVRQTGSGDVNIG